MSKDVKSMRVSATYKDGEDDKVTAELQAVAYFYSAKEMYVHVETSTEYGQLGENVVIIHLRSYLAFHVSSYVVSYLSISSKFPEILFIFLRKCKFFIFAGRVKRSGHPRSGWNASASDQIGDFLRSLRPVEYSKRFTSWNHLQSIGRFFQ